MSIEKSDVVSKLVREAEELLKLAFEEFERGVREGSDKVVRDSAEKAWCAVAKSS